MKENFERHFNIIQKEIESTKEKLDDLLFAMNGGYRGKLMKIRTFGMRKNKKFKFGSSSQ